MLGPSTLEKCAALEFLESLLKLLLRVHDNWPVPGHGLLQGLAGNQQETNAVIAGLNHHLIAPVKQDQRAIVRFGGRIRVRPTHRLCRDSEWIGSVAEFS